MNFQVFHYTGTDRTLRFDESAAARFPVDYTHVATVEIADADVDAGLEQVYGQTQHHERPWTDNVRILTPADKAKLTPEAHFGRTGRPINSSVLLQRRSTSVGDVIVAGDRHFVVAGVGFTELVLTAPQDEALTEAAMDAETAEQAQRRTTHFDIYAGLRRVGYTRLGAIKALRVVGLSFADAKAVSDRFEPKEGGR